MDVDHLIRRLELQYRAAQNAAAAAKATYVALRSTAFGPAEIGRAKERCEKALLHLRYQMQQHVPFVGAV